MKIWPRLIPLLAGMAILGGCAGGRDPGLSAQRGEVVHAGLAQVGTPYVYGSADPRRGLDCSGLTYYAHHAAGVRIPRVSTEQRRAAHPVPGRRPHPGDLVFFQIDSGTHHVGLMVDDARFVHASTSRQQVMVSRLDQPYWQARYLGAGTYLD